MNFFSSVEVAILRARSSYYYITAESIRKNPWWDVHLHCHHFSLKELLNLVGTSALFTL